MESRIHSHYFKLYVYSRMINPTNLQYDWLCIGEHFFFHAVRLCVSTLRSDIWEWKSKCLDIKETDKERQTEIRERREKREKREVRRENKEKRTENRGKVKKKPAAKKPILLMKDYQILLNTTTNPLFRFCLSVFAFSLQIHVRECG